MKIVIVGAGVAGLSIGWRLAQAGADVVVLERAQPGRGATWAAAGMISALSEARNAAEAAFAQRSAALWPGFAAEIEQASGAGVAFRVDGRLDIAMTQVEHDEFAARANRNAMLTGEEARAIEPMLAPGIAGALWDPGAAQVDNRALGPALALALLRAGGSLLANEAVVRLEVDASRVVGARTPFALHRADAFVVAAGAWSACLEGLPKSAMFPVIPVKGEMIALEPRGKPPTHLLWGNEIYLVPRHDRLMVGATATREGFDTGLNAAAADWLFERACGLMPALVGWPLAEHWAGLRPGSPDDLPMIGPSAIEGLFVASGQYRNGILFAPAIAEAMCAFILHRRERPDIAVFDPRRFAC